MQTYVTTFRAMGSQVNVWLDTAGDGGAILQRVPGWIEGIEARLSRFRPDSELSRLNAHVGAWVDVSATMATALGEACRAAQATDGLVTPLVLSALLAAGYDRSFEILRAELPRAASPSVTTDHTSTADQWTAIQIDPAGSRVWVPRPVDLGGTAKGWTAQQIADRLAHYGPCLVDLCGDLVARGKPWPIELHDPINPEIPFATFAMADAAVATSGTDFRRWGAGKHHIIDPRSSESAVTDLVSVTVVHPDAVLAEAYAKAALLQGSRDGLAWLTQQTDATAVAFDHQGRVLATDNVQTQVTQGA